MAVMCDGAVDIGHCVQVARDREGAILWRGEGG